MRILVAEDNAVNPKALILTLERFGYRADIVGNGLEALQSLARQPYDLIDSLIRAACMDRAGKLRPDRLPPV